MPRTFRYCPTCLFAAAEHERSVQAHARRRWNCRRARYRFQSRLSTSQSTIRRNLRQRPAGPETTRDEGACGTCGALETRQVDETSVSSSTQVFICFKQGESHNRGFEVMDEPDHGILEDEAKAVYLRVSRAQWAMR